MHKRCVFAGLVLCGKVLIDCGTIARRTMLEDEEASVQQHMSPPSVPANGQTPKRSSNNACDGTFATAKYNVQHITTTSSSDATNKAIDAEYLRQKERRQTLIRTIA